MTTPSPLARACSWCKKFLTPADEARASKGVPVTHTICPDCVRIHFSDLAEEICS
jgi:hypothetical protein